MSAMAPGASEVSLRVRHRDVSKEDFWKPLPMPKNRKRVTQAATAAMATRDCAMPVTGGKATILRVGRLKRGITAAR